MIDIGCVLIGNALLIRLVELTAITCRHSSTNNADTDKRGNIKGIEKVVLI